jgi:glycine/D-amino acid oxidase-like deaminating enzyme
VNDGSPDVARYRSRSLWLDEYPGSLDPRPSLGGDLDCDIAIIGAGFTGLWTAYYLKREAPDARIVVLEKEIAGFGPSGRNGGWVQGGMAGTPSAYGLRNDPDGLARANAAADSSVDEIGAVVEREGIDCDFSKAGALAIATSEPQRQRLLAEVGSGQSLLSPSETEGYVKVPGVRSSYFSPTAARVDPARLVRGLADSCERSGVSIFERTDAIEVAPGSVRCPSGAVRAETVIRATEAFTTQAKAHSRQFLPLYSLMIATEPVPDSTWNEIGWRNGLLISDHHHLFFYAQRTRDGRLAIGGRGSPYRLRTPIDDRNERNSSVMSRLQEAVAKAFPLLAEAEVTHHWGGPLAVPRDWSMSIEFDPATGTGWAGGYTGHGVAASNLSGRTMTDLVLRRETELTAMPWVGHRVRNWEPEPLRFLASRAIVALLERADNHEDRNGRKAEYVRLIRPFLAGK